MATNFLLTSNPFLIPSSSLSKPIYAYYHPIICTVKRELSLCKAANQPPILTKRSLSTSFLTSFVLSLTGKGCFDVANAAILEADDDVELLEKVKRDRKKRLERQGVINSSSKEKGYLQQLVSKLSEVGQAM